MVQKVSKKDFAAYMMDQVLQPCGMMYSSFNQKEAYRNPFLAKDYDDKGKVCENYLRGVPSGGLISNVVDMSHFIMMVLANGKFGDKQILKPSTLAEMVRQQNANIRFDNGFKTGLAWDLSYPDFSVSYSHDGNSFGYVSSMTILPEHKLGVIVLTTSTTGGAVSGPQIYDIITQTLKAGLEIKGIKQSEASSEMDTEEKLETTMLTKDEMRKYPGYYIGMGDKQIPVEIDGDILYADAYGQKNELLFCGNGVFITSDYEDAGLKFAFTNVADKKILEVFENGNRVFLGERVEKDAYFKAWQERLGEYKLVNPGKIVDIYSIPEKIELSYADGFLKIRFSEYSKAPSNSSAWPTIKPVSDTEAQLFRSLFGEPLRVIKENGKETLFLMGLSYEKVATK